MNKPRWTETEINILKSNVEKNFGNLSKAFKLTSQQTGRSYYAVLNYWYRNKDTDKLGITFFACSTKRVITNRKNALKEYLGPRSDDHVAKRDMLAQIENTGSFRLADTNLQTHNRQAINTAEVFAKAAGVYMRFAGDDYGIDIDPQ